MSEENSCPHAGVQGCGPPPRGPPRPGVGPQAVCGRRPTHQPGEVFEVVVWDGHTIPPPKVSTPTCVLARLP